MRDCSTFILRPRSRPPGVAELLATRLEHALQQGFFPVRACIQRGQDLGEGGMMDERKVDGVNVLLVEDYPETRIAMRMLLEVSGYRVVEASDGQEAVELALREQPDIVLMDLRLPKLDGITATRRIRARLGPDLPIIAFSAYDYTEKREEALTAGCTDFLTKPIGIDELEDVLAHYAPDARLAHAGAGS